MKKGIAAGVLLVTLSLLGACTQQPASDTSSKVSSSKVSSSKKKPAASSETADSSSESSTAASQLTAGQFSYAVTKTAQASDGPQFKTLALQQDGQTVTSLKPAGAALDLSLDLELTQAMFSEGHQKLAVTITGLDAKGQAIADATLATNTLSIEDEDRGDYKLQLPVKLQTEALAKAGVSGLSIELTLLVESMKDGKDLKHPLAVIKVPLAAEN
ncbi:hypothetical protein [Lacticaseibacillus yichunensis]|uniref:Lipoprotein n=1 Tax=Lacticaseibacillus yichunensis TaxID=2486015 RepID=A0ABW4CT70_9LACO|nr:hypothetical protein [Lacticaseibacillus yichunensis]